MNIAYKRERESDRMWWKEHEIVSPQIASAKSNV